MLVMMVASAFLLTAADAEIRQASGYVTLIFGAISTWFTAKAMLAEEKREEQHQAHAHANCLLPQSTALLQDSFFLSPKRKGRTDVRSFLF